MKLLSEQQIVTILEASEADRQLLAARMAPHGAGALGDNVTTIWHGHDKLGAFWWWYSGRNKTLVINQGASFDLAARDSYPYFMEAYLQVAHQVGAKQIQTRSARAGVVKRYQKGGWLVEGVSLRKIL